MANGQQYQQRSQQGPPQDFQQQPQRQAFVGDKLTDQHVQEIIRLCTEDGKPYYTQDEVLLAWEMNAPAFIKDFKRFMYTCMKHGTDPILNEEHLEYKWTSKYGYKCAPITHVEAYRRKANEKDIVDGFKQVFGSDDIGGIYVDTLIWKKGSAHPFENRQYQNEYLETAKNNYIVKGIPHQMTAKASEAGCWRKFGAFSGSIGEDETDLIQHYASRDNDAPDGNSYSDVPEGVQAEATSGGLTVGRKAKTEAPAEPKPEPKPEAKTEAKTETPAPAQTQTQQAAPAAKTPEPPPQQSAPDPEPPPAKVNGAPAPTQVNSAAQSDAPLSPREEAEKLRKQVTELTGFRGPQLNSFYLGYFGADKPADLSKNPADYIEPHKKLLAYLAGGEAKVRIAKTSPAAVGKELAGASEPAQALDYSPELLAQIKARVSEDPDSALLMARFAYNQDLRTVDEIMQVYQNRFKSLTSQEDIDLCIELGTRSKHIHTMTDDMRRTSRPARYYFDAVGTALKRNPLDCSTAEVDAALLEAIRQQPQPSLLGQ